MWADRIEDLLAFQLAQEFKREVYRLVDNSPSASRDFRFKDQVFDSAAGPERTLNEGFHRKRNTEFRSYIRYALGSLAEAKGHVRDGIDRRHFCDSDCGEALALAKRCKDVTEKLLESVERAIEREKRLRRPRNRPPKRNDPAG